LLSAHDFFVSVLKLIGEVYLHAVAYIYQYALSFLHMSNTPYVAVAALHDDVEPI